MEKIQEMKFLILGLRLFTKVGEALKLVLIDLFDDGVVYGSKHGLFTCEVLIKVIDIPLGFL